MNVVVSAIVDPWVTTLSFVVALAMRIQDSKVKEIVVLGHSLNDVDSEYFELIEKYIRPKYWTISQYKGSPCLGELKNYSFSKKIRFCNIDKFL